MPSRIFTAALAGQAGPAEMVAFRRHMLGEMARMSCDDGLVMTLHPGVCRGHHGPTTERFGADTGNDIPVRCRIHRGAAPVAAAVRHPSEPAPGAVHPRRDGVLPRARAVGRVLPVGVRRRALVVPRCPGRDPPVPRRGHRDGRLHPDVRVHRRHPRLLLDSGPPRHVPPHRRRLPRRSGRRTPPRRGRGARDRSSTSSPPARGRCSSCDRRSSRAQPATAAPRRRSAGASRAWATSSVLIRPGTPSTPRTPSSGVSPPSRDEGLGSPQTLAAQDGLYTLVTRAAAGDRFDVIGSVSRAHAANDHEPGSGTSPRPQVRAVTVTITEAGYLRGADGGLDRARDDVQADVATLRRDPTARRAHGAGAAGRRARRPPPRRRRAAHPDPLRQPARQRRGSRPSGRRPRRHGRPRPCRLERRVPVDGHHDGRPDHPADRPRRRRRRVRGHRLRDDAPVVTEPFREWVLSGTFPAGRPRWEDAGATFTDDIVPFEHRNCGCSTAATRCWPTPARSGATTRSPTRSPTTRCAAGSCSGGPRRPRI